MQVSYKRGSFARSPERVTEQLRIKTWHRIQAAKEAKAQKYPDRISYADFIGFDGDY